MNFEELEGTEEIEEIEEKCYAGVYILNLSYHLDKIYDYYMSDDLRSKAVKGAFVVVPFGGGNKKRVAVIWEIKSSTGFSRPKAIKPIEEVLEYSALNTEQLELAAFLKDTVFSTIGEAVKVIAPTGVKSNITVYYYANGENIDTEELKNTQSERTLLVLSYIISKKASLDELKSEFGDKVSYVLKNLCKQGYITEESVTEKPVREKTVKYVALNIDSEDEDIESSQEDLLKNITRQQEKVIDYLVENGDSRQGEILDALEISESAIKTLEKKGLVTVYDKEIFRDFYEDSEFSYDESDESIKGELSQLQNEAYQRLSELYREKRPCAAFLHGVTGSGKTHVLKALIDDVIADGKQIIMLVPEIALTPQTINFFRAYYRDRVKVVHSVLSPGEKFDTWKKIENGEVDIVIGTRSAVFAPFKNLGMIIIDEEQEHTYKSEQKPYYHARDVARFRCAKNKAMMILASATPSVDSYYKAETGLYHLITLNERYGDAILPEVIIADMRDDTPENKMLFLSEIFQKEIAQNLSGNEQVIIFQNRRGYHNFLSCRSCGTVVLCPNCSISLKIHAEEHRGLIKSRRIPSRLVCHYCGYTAEVLKTCPECQSEHMYPFGTGTQKCEDDIIEMFPEAKIIRLDADTASSKHSYDNILNSVKNNEVDILIGTQMVAKGHNFQNVTLVGVLFAEQGLLLDDYRANERTFEMIVQVVGRAGRYDKKGRAVIQTYNPESEVIKYAVEQNYEKFYEKEIRLRKAAVFPPYCDICVINISSEFENEAVITANNTGALIKDRLENEYNDVKMVVFGPFPASVYKINKTFRMRYIIKCKSNRRFREMMSGILIDIQKQIKEKVAVNIDINPNMI